MKTFEEWKRDKQTLPPIGFKVYKATKFELFLSKFLPYYLPFINKRTRVKLRAKFKFKYLGRLHKDITEILIDAYTERKPFISPKNWNKNDYEWEVLTNG
jgi:hypothetical protein